MDNIGTKLCRNALDPVAQRFDFSPFAKERQSRNRAGHAMEYEAFHLLDRRTVCRVPCAGYALHLEPSALKTFQDRARAESVAGMERQRMVEDMKHACHYRNAVTHYA